MQETAQTKARSSSVRAYPHGERLAVAIRLARDLDTCRALLRGDSVDPDRLDAAELRRARSRLLVRLDVHAIDLLSRDAA